MKSKFELPESIFYVTKGLPNKPKKPSHIIETPSVKTKSLLPEKFKLLNSTSTDTETISPKSLTTAKLAILMIIIAIGLSIVKSTYY
jgi:hypothetical protein